MSSAERANKKRMTAARTKTQQEQWMVENQVFQLFDLFADLPRNAKSALYSLSLFNFNFLLDQKKKKKNFLGLGFQFVVVVVVVVFFGYICILM